jgi:dihydroorotase
MTATTITLRRPDDWHLHVRDGDMLKAVLPYTAKVFARAIIMPNLTPPVTSKDAAAAYRQRILDAVPAGVKFTPLMTLYLTDDVNVDDLRAGFKEGIYTAAKLYPAHATTNSAKGVTDIKNIAGALNAMQEIGMPLLVHGEVNDPEVDIFDREKVFLQRVLAPMLYDYAALKIVLEHITTTDSVQFVREHSRNHKLAATITPHHLYINRTSIFQGGLRPHYYCLPVAKRETHRQALVYAATSGEPCFFLGTDSAPHTARAKESACGCAGVFSAPNALQLYAEVFDNLQTLDRLEAFASLNGPRFYGLPVNEEKITLTREAVDEPAPIDLSGGEKLVPFMLGSKRSWNISSAS